MPILCEPFGTLQNGQPIQRWTLTQDAVTVSVLTYGATLQSFILGDTDVALGFDSIEDYETADCPYIGTTVGRYANRLSTPLNVAGEAFPLDCNEGDSVMLHGGEGGLHRKVWQAREAEGDVPGVTLTTHCAHMESGCPGDMDLQITFTLHPGGILRLDYEATCDRDTVINLTNHAFFNLNGVGGEDIRNHRVHMKAHHYLPVDERLLPLGDPVPVEGTPFDFTGETLDESASFASRLGLDHPQLSLGNGIDHNFCIDGQGFRPAARVTSPLTGLALECRTDQPGVQIYHSQFLKETAGKQGVPLGQYAGFCLETQHYPNSPAHPTYPSVLLKAGETFSSRTEYQLIQEEVQ